MGTDHIFNQRLNELAHLQNNDPPELLRSLDAMTVRELSELLPKMFSTGSTGAQREALRDTVQAVIYRKLTELLVESIMRLDTSTSRLARVGWWLTIVVGVVGILVTLVVAIR